MAVAHCLRCVALWTQSWEGVSKDTVPLWTVVLAYWAVC